ncbi:hypothetical protein [Microvirga massiliensis]|uniref:hypothetical protein n=1 Tax=Microvirga massiliensis TaxID=1033741 RepID=UPI00062BEB4C|nr:hypothetical protein [Microvirga massiliensis]
MTKYFAAGLTAILTFFVASFLPVFVEELIRDFMGWQAPGPSLDMGWWRAGAGFIVAGSIFWLVVRRRNAAALEWRKTLAARARA